MATSILIDPKELIRKMSIDALCETADNYYRLITDSTHLMSKPFASLIEGPELLYRLGLLLSGLQLSKGFRILDFASGTCWLSRVFNQFGCATVSVDPSAQALEIGRRLFAEQPVLGGCIEPPAFLLFNGRRIDVEDNFVDRIACFDGFHHIPNQKEVLAELFRVLKDGGIAGFSEPGRNHSRAAQSQYEMSNYDVLENDIIIEDIVGLATEVGFTGAYLKPLIGLDAVVTSREYTEILERQVLPDRLVASALRAMESGTVFFLVKGQLHRDSRSHVGLRHELRLASAQFQVARGASFNIQLEMLNTGGASWLARASKDIGTVKAGMHLYTANRQLINLDFHRWQLPEDVAPGKSVFASIDVPSPAEAGEYLIGVDLVSEGVCWFENVGSQPQTIHLTVS